MRQLIVVGLAALTMTFGGDAFASEPTLKNLGIAGRPFPTGAGGLVPLLVDEANQGDLDLDGNGVRSLSVLFLYDQATKVLHNLGIDLGSAIHGSSQKPGSFIFSVPELVVGSDVNGDGDLYDPVIHVYDPKTHEVNNLWRVARSGVPGGRHVFVPPEPYENAALYDLDSKELFDIEAGSYSWFRFVGKNALFGLSPGSEVAIFDYSTGTMIPQGFNAAAPVGGGNWITFLQPEGTVDRNQDGDTLDTVLLAWNPEATSLVPINLAVAGVSAFQPAAFASEKWLAFLVSEPANGFTDINGDGDAEDLVLHVAELAGTSPVVINTRQQVNDQIAVSGSLVAFRREDVPFEDGDLMVYDFERGLTIAVEGNIGLYGNFFVTNQLVAFLRPESLAGDLNDDGDTADHIVKLYDQSRGEVVNTFISASSLSFRAADSWVAAVRSECPDDPTWRHCIYAYDSSSRQLWVREQRILTWKLQPGALTVEALEYDGRRYADLNADGDTFDNVAFVLELPQQHTLPGAALFVDGFEAGTLGAWVRPEYTPE